MTESSICPSQFDAFFSYSTKDQETAFSLVEELETRGVNCWIAPRNIPAGKSWAGSIIEGLSQCPIFLILLTESSNLSNQVLREDERAVANGSMVIPVRLDDISMSNDLQYYLSTIQWLDTSESALGDCAERIAQIAKGTSAPPLLRQDTLRTPGWGSSPGNASATSMEADLSSVDKTQHWAPRARIENLASWHWEHCLRY